jgi:hypothetical protein
MTTAKTWRAPDDVYERLREAAYSDRIPQNRIIDEAVAQWLDRRTFTETRLIKALCDWFEANGIDPKVVCGESHASIADGQLTVRIKDRPNGRDVDVIDPNDPTQVLTKTITVPITVPPTVLVAGWLKRGAPTTEKLSKQLLAASDPVTLIREWTED